MKFTVEASAALWREAQSSQSAPPGGVMVPANEPDVVNVMALATRATVKRPWALRIDPSHQLTTEVRLSNNASSAARSF
ncbi:MAG TPA: hypothetical protein VKE51_42265 [Vicinamibacterales bacterium]|nr:hypothetical protein [Vicinamibacterales bacterium]